MMQQARRPLEPHADRVNKSKLNLHYTRGITPKCVMSGGIHLRCFAAGATQLRKKHRNGC